MIVTQSFAVTFIMVLVVAVVAIEILILIDTFEFSALYYDCIFQLFFFFKKSVLCLHYTQL
jgi:hypothetical protein